MINQIFTLLKFFLLRTSTLALAKVIIKVITRKNKLRNFIFFNIYFYNLKFYYNQVLFQLFKKNLFIKKRYF